MQITPHTAVKGISGLVDALRAQTGTQIPEYALTRLYAVSHTMYICANIWAENVASVPMRAVDSAGEPIEHPVNAVFQSIANYQDVARRSEIALFFTGMNLVVPQPNIVGGFTPWRENLQWLNPHIWDTDTTPNGGLRGFRVVGSNPYDVPNFIPKDRAVFFQLIDLDDDFDGVAPAEVAYYAGVSQAELWQTVYSYMVNRAMPAGILQGADEMALRSDDAPRTLQTLLNKLFRGAANAGKVLVSPDRLEYIQIQQSLDQVGKLLDTLPPSIRKAITQAANIPDQLVDFSDSTFANAEEAVQFWQKRALVPRVEWYAAIYSQFFSQWYGERIIIKPDLEGVLPQEDITDKVNTQVSNGYLDLYSAQVATGIEPDMNLRGIYLLPGFGPVPSAEIPNLWKYQNGGGALATPALPTVAPESDLTPLPDATASGSDACIMLSLANNPDLVGLQKQVKSLCAGLPAEWNTPEDFHVTLAYMPTADEAQIDELISALPSLNIPAMRLNVGSLKAFDSVGKQALHFRVRRNTDLLNTQEALYDLLLDLDIPVSSYSLPGQYTPHITMGYVTGKPPTTTFRSRLTVEPFELLVSVDDEVVYRQPIGKAGKSEPDPYFVSDAIFKEIQIAARKGEAFTPEHLDPHTTAYIKTLHEINVERETIVTAAKSFYGGVQAAKALQATRLDFELTFEDVLASVRGDNLPKQRARIILGNELDRYIGLAYLDGLTDGGIADAALDDEDTAKIAALKSEARAYLGNFLDTLYTEDGISDAQAIGKPEMWFNKSVYPAYTEGLYSAARNAYFLWVYGDTEHCDTCKALNGQVHRLRDYRKRDLLPKSTKLACGGYRCQCQIIPQPGGRAVGTFPKAA